MKHGPLILTAVVLLYSLSNLAAGFPLPNFSPMAALVFACGSWFRGSARWVYPVGAWLLLSASGSYFQGYDFFAGSRLTGICYVIIFTVAMACRRFTASPKHLFWLSLSAPIVFFAVSNFESFLTDPRYAKTLTGFTQAMWTGLPTDVLPTWAFLRNSLLANSVFSLVFFRLAASAQVSSAKHVEATTSLTCT